MLILNTLGGTLTFVGTWAPTAVWGTYLPSWSPIAILQGAGETAQEEELRSVPHVRYSSCRGAWPVLLAPLRDSVS